MEAVIHVVRNRMADPRFPSDACAVIAEAAVAFCLADAVLEAYGGDTMEDVLAQHRGRTERYGRS